MKCAMSKNTFKAKFVDLFSRAFNIPCTKGFSVQSFFK